MKNIESIRVPFSSGIPAKGFKNEGYVMRRGSNWNMDMVEEKMVGALVVPGTN